MRIVGRVLMILIAALVVVGITFTVGRSGLLGSSNFGGPQGGFGQTQAGGPPAGFRPDRGGPDGAGMPWYATVLDAGQNAAIIAVLIAAVTILRRVIRSKRRPTPADRQPLPPTSG